ncbi:carbonic anhydrase 7-like [Bacillus rossius redtenbacheri]|uniref:carbonic anhydrase 7-like n=1 Tax=Bacillus rossius redtenbacheri TaxID=93214 RepID=UPI002FDEA2CC
MAAARLSLLALLLAGKEIRCADKRSPAFGYDGEIGPEHWAKSYETCAGKFQSPVDIEEHLVDQVRLPPLRFRGFHAFPASSTLTNNGHTVMLQMNRTEEAVVSGGPLSGDYSFAQLHFHWGANDSMGSEDTINNHTFPLELHMVFFKREYGDVTKAMHYEDGLTVLAVFFEVYGSDNEVYSELVSYLPRVAAPGASARLLRPNALESLLPRNRHLYFTYHGSLTTPPCSEVVIWVDFKQPVLLSHRQVAAFRRMQSDHGRLTQNFRPIQPLSGRLIQFNVADEMRAAAAPSRDSGYTLHVVSVVLLLAVSWR